MSNNEIQGVPIGEGAGFIVGHTRHSTVSYHITGTTFGPKFAICIRIIANLTPKIVISIRDFRGLHSGYTAKFLAHPGQ